MSEGALEADRFGAAPTPRSNHLLIGHEEVETSLRQAWDAGRLSHALLLGGPEGIGKATFAYRLARFVLSGGRAPAGTLEIGADHPVSRQVAALSHPDLLVLRRTPNDAGKLPTAIPAESVRKVRSFFGSTAALGGWRVCVVDTLDEMNATGANALLKTLEEPPERALFVLVSHAPGRLLPTIRSRCRLVPLRALDNGQVRAALDHLAGHLPDLERGRFDEAAAASGGSVREALALLSADRLAVRRATHALLDQLPHVDPSALHSLGEKLQADKDGGAESFVATVEGWIADRATGRVQSPGVRLARLPEVWEKVRRAAIDADVYNLDRKTFVFRTFASLKEAMQP